MRNDVIFCQLFEAESSTYTYIIGDTKTREVALIDPVLETVDRDLQLIKELDVNLVYILDTHIHADHITGAGEIRKVTEAKTAVSRHAQVDCADILLKDGQELWLGNKKISVMETPGHTASCVSFYFENMIFTGDALLIRGTGRTDFQQGSSDHLYESIQKLFKLPAETLVYPAHDYRGHTASTIELEKKYNVRVGANRSKQDFLTIMSELKLAHPKKIHEALPANLKCGLINKSQVLTPQMVDGIPESSPQEVYNHREKLLLIDVRRPDEFVGELGHINGSRLITQGPDLTKFLESGNRQQEIVFICRSGNRSSQAVTESIKLGYQRTINMSGGMIQWNEMKLPVSKT